MPCRSHNVQIPEFIVFEDRLDNSFQRDAIKMESLRMRLTHESVTSDLIDVELIELKFIFERRLFSFSFILRGCSLSLSSPPR